MKNLIFYLSMTFSLMFYSNIINAQDPFDKTQRVLLKQKDGNQETENNQCYANEHNIAKDIDFSKVKLIGFISEKEKTEIFVAYEQTVFNLKLGQFFSHQNLEFISLNKSQAEFIDKCHQDKKYYLYF